MADLLRLEPYHIYFLLSSMYNTLPSLSHLHMWGLRDDPYCKLCGRKGSLAHILSGCKASLIQGRYRWCHDKVLLSLAGTLKQERCKKRLGGLTFNKNRARPSATRALAKSNLLQATSSWEMKVDMGRMLQFPEVVRTPLRPDIVLWSAKDHKIILIELTVPWDEGCEEAHKRKA